MQDFVHSPYDLVGGRLFGATGTGGGPPLQAHLPLGAPGAREVCGPGRCGADVAAPGRAESAARRKA